VSSKTTKFQVLHILAALGSAGMTASFFFLLNYLTIHPGDAFISFDILMRDYVGRTDPLGLLIQFYALGAIASAGLHFFLLKRWLVAFQDYRKTQDYKDLKNSNREVQLMAIPLTFSMSMNVFFILGAIFIPGLFSEVTIAGITTQLIDFLFVIAGIYFAGMLVLALTIFGRYWSRLAHGDFNFDDNTNLSQMLAIFAFGMVGVSLGALSFSKVELIAFIGMSMAYIVLTIAAMLGLIKLILGFKSMFEGGIKPQTSVTLLLPVAVLGMFVVGLYRADIGAMHAFNLERDTLHHLMVFIIGGGVSLLIGTFALLVMRRNQYIKRMSEGEFDASSFALICPGFAFEVQLVLLLNIGLIMTGMINFGSTAHLVFWIPLIVLQATTIYYLFKLLKMHNFLSFAKS
jgi:hypothetical protein